MLWKLHLSILLRNGWTIGAWMWKHKLCLHPLLLQVTSYKYNLAHPVHLLMSILILAIIAILGEIAYN